MRKMAVLASLVAVLVCGFSAEAGERRLSEDEALQILAKHTLSPATPNSDGSGEERFEIVGGFLAEIMEFGVKEIDRNGLEYRYKYIPAVIDDRVPGGWFYHRGDEVDVTAYIAFANVFLVGISYSHRLGDTRHGLRRQRQEISRVDVFDKCSVSPFPSLRYESSGDESKRNAEEVAQAFLALCPNAKLISYSDYQLAVRKIDRYRAAHCAPRNLP